MQIISQNDPKYKGLVLTPSRLTFGGYGCTSSCCCMAIGLTPNQFIGGLVYQKDGNLNWDRLVANGWIDGYSRVRSDNQSARLQAVRDYGCVLVCVDLPTVAGRDDHWILQTSATECIDPWDGKKKLISAFKPVGYCVLKLKQKTDGYAPYTPAVELPQTVRITAAKLNVRSAPTASSQRITNIGTKDGYLHPDDGDIRVIGCVPGDIVDGYNAWYISCKGNYFSSAWTNKPKNI